MKLYVGISQEVGIISRLNHPSVLKFNFYSPINFKSKPKPVIITEYASNGSLEHQIKHDMEHSTDRRLDDTRKLIIIYGIVSGMSYLHSNDILHRDLKPDNVLLDEFFFPKIADFGISKSDKLFQGSIIVQSASNVIKGTPTFLSPEVWSNGKHTKSSDIYAFSILVYELMTLKVPFSEYNVFTLGPAVKRGKRPEFEDNEISKIYKNLIVRCWSQDPTQRPTFDQILIELRTDRRYITDSVNESDFLNYVKFVDEYKTSFDTSKVFIENSNFLKYLQELRLNNFKMNPIDKDKINFIEKFQMKSSLFPYKYYKDLSLESQHIVEDALLNNEIDKIFGIGRSLIEGRYDFPIDVKIGLDLIKKAINEGHKQAVL